MRGKFFLLTFSLMLFAYSIALGQWEKIDNTTNAPWYGTANCFSTIVGGEGRILYAANGMNGLFRTTNEGITWIACDAENTSHIVAIMADPSPDNEEYVYIARFDPNNPTINGFWRSTDYGFNFSRQCGDMNYCGDTLGNVKILSIRPAPGEGGPTEALGKVVVTCWVYPNGEGNILTYEANPYETPICWDQKYGDFPHWYEVWFMDPGYAFSYMSNADYALNFDNPQDEYFGTRRCINDDLVFTLLYTGIWKHEDGNYYDCLIGQQGTLWYFEGVKNFRFNNGDVTSWPPIAFGSSSYWQNVNYPGVRPEFYLKTTDDGTTWDYYTSFPGTSPDFRDGDIDYFADVAPIKTPGAERDDEYTIFLTQTETFNYGNSEYTKPGIYKYQGHTGSGDWTNLTPIPTAYFTSGKGVMAYDNGDGSRTVFWGANQSPTDRMNSYGSSTYGAVYRTDHHEEEWTEVNKHMSTLACRELCVYKDTLLVAGLTDNVNSPYLDNQWLISFSPDTGLHWSTRRGQMITPNVTDVIRDMKMCMGENPIFAYAAPWDGPGSHFDTIFVSTDKGKTWEGEYGFDANHSSLQVWNLANYDTNFYATISGLEYVLRRKPEYQEWDGIGTWNGVTWGEARGLDAIPDDTGIVNLFVGSEHAGVKRYIDDSQHDWESYGQFQSMYEYVNIVKAAKAPDGFNLLAKAWKDNIWYLIHHTYGDIYWHDVSSDIPFSLRDFQDIEFYPDKPNVAMVSTIDGNGDGHCFLSLNEGLNWAEFSTGIGTGFGRIKDVSFWQGSNPAYYSEGVYLATDQGLYKWPIIFAAPVISSNTTWHSGTSVFIDQDIEITQGDTLTIEPGVQIFISPDYNYPDRRADGPTIIVDGVLNASGTSGSHIEFIPCSNPDSATNRGWIGIEVFGKANLDYVDISGAIRGIVAQASSELELTHVTVANCMYGIQALSEAIVSVNNSFISDCYYDGIYAWGESDVTVNSTTIEDVVYYGIRNFNSITRVDSCSIINCGRYGVYISYTDSSFKDSSIVSRSSIQYSVISEPDSSQYAIYVSGLSLMRISNNLLRGYGQGGIKLNMCDGMIDSTTVKKTQYYGINAYKASPTVGYCVFDSIMANTSVGILADGGSYPKVRYSQFKNLRDGVVAQDANLPDLGDSSDYGYNDFEGCTYHYIKHQDATSPYFTLNAIGNYYGSSGPDTSKFLTKSLISYTPYVVTDPFPKLRTPSEPPTTYTLSSNYPNPFNPTTTIKFNLVHGGQTRLEIFNIVGQRVSTLVQDYMAPGEYSYTWNGCDDNNNPVASGVYLYRIESAGFTQTKTMTLLK